MNSRRIILLVVAVAGAVAIPFVSFGYFDVPYIAMGCGYLLMTLVLLFFVTSTTSKVVLINSTAIIAALTGFEWYLYSNRPYIEGRIENVYDGKYTIEHPDLGYTLGANLSRPNVTKYVDDKVIYNVSYSTNEHGLRRSMGADRAAHPFGCILVYGGSFAYGEGINDEDVLAWQIDEQTGHRHRVFNFGLHGYGPHHMLASLESGHTESIADCNGEPVVVVYQGISDHVRRTAGLTSWDEHGPWYRLDNQGQAVYAGHFDETITRGRIFHRLYESYVFKMLLGPNQAGKDSNLDLFLAVVKRAETRSNELFDVQAFVVIYWDDGPEDPIAGRLQDQGLQVFTIEDILPGSRSNESEYRLVGDSHPSPLANAKLAEFLISQGLVPQHQSTAQSAVK